MKDSQKNFVLTFLIILVIALTVSNVWTFMSLQNTLADKSTQQSQTNGGLLSSEGLSQANTWTLPVQLPPDTSSPGHFSSPRDIAVDMNGYVYVADTGNNRIQVFDPYGNFVMQFRVSHYLRAIAVVNSSLYALEDNIVMKYTLNGTLLSSWYLVRPAQGSSPVPVDIAVDYNENVYALDSANFCVQKFSSNGTFIKQFGSQGEGSGRFVASPYSIAVDKNANVYVSAIISSESAPFGEKVPDGGVVKFNSNGEFLTNLGVMELYYPKQVSVDTKGNIYVVDTGTGFVHATVVLPPDGESAVPQYVPASLAFDNKGYVYMVDLEHASISKSAAI